MRQYIQLLKYSIVFVFIFSVGFFNSPVFSQEALQDQESPNEQVENTPDEIEIIKQTLDFGIDSAVVEQIKTLSKLKVEDFVTSVLQRMQSTENAELIIAGFTYLRELASSDGLDLALEYIVNFKQYPVRAVQYAFFYVTDLVDSLDDEQKTQLLDITLQLSSNQNPALALPALGLISLYYDESEIPYVQDEIESLEENSQITTNSETSNKETPVVPNEEIDLFSYKLMNIYEDVSVESIKEEILITFGKIQSYNRIPFIIKIAKNPRANTSSKRSAIIALASFRLENTDTTANLITERRELFDNFIKDENPVLRAAVLEALQPPSTDDVGNVSTETFSLWVKNALRDNDSDVRKAVLVKIENVFSTLAAADINFLFDAVTFMLNYDPDVGVRQRAVQTLSQFPNGKGYILDAIENMDTINPVNRQYLSSALKYDDSSGIEVVVTLINKLFDNTLQGAVVISNELALLQYIAEITAIQDNPAVSSIVENLLPHPDTSIKKNIITAIARNKLKEYNPQLQAISEDIELPNDVRVQARRTKEILEKSDSQEP